MGINATPSAERVHIGIFGRRNAGKSSIINAITGQNLAIVSDVKGTTTDPVIKAMELLPLGPVVLIDTPGLDDEGALGEMRVKKSYQVLNKVDIAVLVVDGEIGAFQIEKKLIERFEEKKIPYIVAINKVELLTEQKKTEIASFFEEKNLLFVSAAKNDNINILKEKIASLKPQEDKNKRLVGDLLACGDIVVLVVPIDSAAPKGRLILPQQQVIRDCLEAGAIPVVTREKELKQALNALVKKPKVVITDSQAFERVAKETPEGIYLTSFSILFARYKGSLKQQAAGAKEIWQLKDGDRVLISEGCTHHRQCGDIGTQKLPNWILKATGKQINFAFTSGTEFPEDLSSYALIIHCGGCTLNEREMQYRLKCAKDQGIPMTNYGTAIADIHGVLDRSMEIFKDNKD